ncbi:MAG: type IV secretion system DNA-binding domain-containing protein [Janthinobacterium lividum]
MTDKQTLPFQSDSFTRGGQLFSHGWRMRYQNFKIVALLSLLCGALGIGLGCLFEDVSLWLVWDFYLLSYLGGKFKMMVWPWLQQYLLIDVDVFLRTLLKGTKGIPSAYKKLSQLTTDLWVPNRGRIYMRTFNFLKNPWVLQEASRVHQVLLWGLGSWTLGMGLMIWKFKTKSQKARQDKVISGKEVLPVHKVAKLISAAGRSCYNVAPLLPLPKDGENQHIAIIGATRMGKTNCIKYLLDQVRAKGGRAVILDSTGELTRRYYRPERDFLVNPFDSRSVSWTIWGEELKDHEYDTWAKSVVPEGKGDPTWHNNARLLLATTARILSKQDTPPTMKDILKWCCWEPLGKNTELFYQDSAMSGIMRLEAEKTAAGIRMQVGTCLASYEYLTSTQEPFSITKWIKDRKQEDTWLFLKASPTERPILAPFLASLFNFTLVGLERAGEDFKNRLWMVSDEVAGWDFAIESLKRLISEGAKCGACCVLGFQNKSQIDDIYSRAITKTLMSNSSTKVIFRSPDPETAKDLSLTLGEQDIVSSVENISVGSRDGINISSQHRTQATIPATKIMSLNALEAYVLLPGDYPATKVKYQLVT